MDHKTATDLAIDEPSLVLFVFFVSALNHPSGALDGEKDLRLALRKLHRSFRRLLIEVARWVCVCVSKLFEGGRHAGGQKIQPLTSVDGRNGDSRATTLKAVPY